MVPFLFWEMVAMLSFSVASIESQRSWTMLATSAWVSMPACSRLLLVAVSDVPSWVVGGYDASLDVRREGHLPKDEGLAIGKEMMTWTGQ